MASTTGKSRCVQCGKDKATSRCNGCFQDFCFNHLLAHREDLNQELDRIECDRDQLRDVINKRTELSQSHSLLDQIDQWERSSIQQVKHRANQCRQMLLEQTTSHITEIEKRLAEMTDELKHIRKENDFNEIDLSRTKQQLAQLTEQLHHPPNITLQHQSTALVTDISVRVPSGASISSNSITSTTKWKEHGITVAGEKGKGNQLDRLSYPVSIYVDDNHQIYIADCDNHRIVRWNCNTNNVEVVAGGNDKGNAMNQLNEPMDVVVDQKNDRIVVSDTGNRRVMQWPRRSGTQGQIIISNVDCKRLAMNNNGDLYVSNDAKHEVRRWKIGESEGVVVAGGNGRGDQLNQLDIPTFLFVDDDLSVYVSDWGNGRVMKWLEGAREGVVVAGGQGPGNSLSQLSSPQGMIVDSLGNVFVADAGNHRVMRWLKGSREGSIVAGGNGSGNHSNQLFSPRGLSFDQEGRMYVADCGNHRIQRFDIDRA